MTAWREGNVVRVIVPGVHRGIVSGSAGVETYTVQCSLWCRAEGRSWWALVPHASREIMEATKAGQVVGTPEGLIRCQVVPGSSPQTWRTIK